MSAAAMSPSARPQVANGMQWLRRELQLSLNRARMAIEHFLESPDERQSLYVGLDEIRVVRGTLGMIECFGAQILANEMELMLRALAEDRIEEADEAFATLSGATLQLYDYIDLLAIGEEDCALALQPAVNELRLRRGLVLMTEADLFSEQMRGLYPADSDDRHSAADVWTSRAAASRELPAFQIAFLQWFRGKDVPATLDRITGIASRLSAISGSRAVSEFWSATSALAESLTPAANESLDIKRLFGRASALLKAQAESGETAALGQLGDTTNHILLHLGRAPRVGTRGQALVTRYRLAALLPSANALDDIRRRLRGPSTTVLSRVHEEIARDFAEIKDDLDLALRTRRYKAVELSVPRERLRRLANSLSTLGLVPQQQIVINQARALEEDCTEAVWLDIAVAILRVELSLEETLFRTLDHQSATGRRLPLDLASALPHTADLRDSRHALTRELLVNLALFKAAIDRLMRGDSGDEVEHQLKWLSEIRAGLEMIEAERAALAIQRISNYIAHEGLRFLSVSAAEAERFADAVSGMELYLEALRDGLPQADRLLSETEALLVRLQAGVPAAVPRAVESAPLDGAHSAADASQTDARRGLDSIAEDQAQKPAPAAQTASDEAMASLAGEPAARTHDELKAEIAGTIDPEIREIFIEEAGDVLSELRRQLSKFRNEPGSQTLLTEVRRAFHTLKGSGRMVGARRIAELGWAIESLLNQCLSGALPVRPPVLEAVDRAVGQLPGLIENFINGTPESADVSDLIERAQEIASGDIQEIDMLAVFKEDARERLDAMRRWLEAQDIGYGASSVPPELMREIHTLRGAAAVVNASAISTVAMGLENYLSALQFAGASVPPSALALLADAVLSLRGWVEAAGSEQAGEADSAPWIERIEALQATLKVTPRAKDAVETYALAALDELQRFEKGLEAWIGTSNASVKPSTASLQALSMQAARAGDKPSSSVATTFLARLSAATAPPPTTAAPLFGEAVEGMYGLLERFREGQTADTTALIARIDALPLISTNDDFDVELAEIFIAEADELLAQLSEAIEVLSETPTNFEERILAQRVMHTLKGSARMAGYWAIGETSQTIESQLGGDGALPLVQLNAGIDELARLVDEARTQLLGMAPAAPSAAFDSVEMREPAVSDFAVEDILLDWSESSDVPESIEFLIEEPVSEAVDSGEAEPAILAQGDGGHRPTEIRQTVEQDFVEPPVFDGSLEPISTGFESAASEASQEGFEESRGEPVTALDEPASTETYPFFEAEPPFVDTVVDAQAPIVASSEVEVEAYAAESNAAGEFAARPSDDLQFVEIAGDTTPGMASTGDAPFPDSHGEAVSPEPPLVADEPVEAERPSGEAEPAGFIGEDTLSVLDRDAAAGPWDEAGASVSEDAAANDFGASPEFTRPIAESWMADAALAGYTDDEQASTEAQWQAGEPPLYEESTSWQAPAFVEQAMFGDGIENVSLESSQDAELSAELSYDEPAQSASDFDYELTEIFSAESTELLESLDGSIEAWQGGDEVEAVREIQRSLHTLKGGARMAGVAAMGDTAHQMESDVNTLISSGEFPSEAAFNQLRAQIHTLRGLHDQLLRGDLSVGPPVPPEYASALLQESRGAAPQIRRSTGSAIWNPELFWRPEEIQAGGLGRRETARVPVEALESMLNEAGEISIYRSRLEQQNIALQQQLAEMTQTIVRVRDQLRLLDAETEAQIAARGLTGQAPDRYAHDFDPLEMDRYSRMQELSRSLAESINDLSSVRGAIEEVVSEKDVLLQQQGRINSNVQQGLMSTLMVPFSRQVPRLERVVRQTAVENGRQAEVIFSGVEAELDRNVLERMTAPLEHLLRNAVVHGIELPPFREAVGKSASGTIRISLKREGSQLLLEVADDGAGLDYSGIRIKAIERGLMRADAVLSDAEIARFILEPGFSTASQLTQDAGRGVGMDVVAAGVKQLGGSLEMTSEVGRGTRFLVRLPLTLALSQALLVSVGHEIYAIPLAAVEGIVRVPRNDDYWLGEDAPSLKYGDEAYRVRYLGDLLQAPRTLSPDARSFMAILVRVGDTLNAGERRAALIVDQLIGNREIVSKAVGPQISAVPGVTGATILPDGRVVLILDVPALVIWQARKVLQAPVISAEEKRELVMVVDDSVTMRRIAERLLVRQGFRVVSARDGLDAMAQLQTETPAIVLLDIEMPRADGFEVAAFMRNTPRLSEIPIIMITSRSGEKHRARARQLGVERYLIKPYQEDQLIAEVQSLRAQVPA